MPFLPCLVLTTDHNEVYMVKLNNIRSFYSTGYTAYTYKFRLFLAKQIPRNENTIL